MCVKLSSVTLLTERISSQFSYVAGKGKDKNKQKGDRAEAESCLDDVHMATLTWGWPSYMFCYMSPSNDTSMVCIKE